MQKRLAQALPPQQDKEQPVKEVATQDKQPAQDAPGQDKQPRDETKPKFSRLNGLESFFVEV